VLFQLVVTIDIHARFVYQVNRQLGIPVIHGKGTAFFRLDHAATGNRYLAPSSLVVATAVAIVSCVRRALD
jgi:hypothetical protein